MRSKNDIRSGKTNIEWEMYDNSDGFPIKSSVHLVELNVENPITGALKICPNPINDSVPKISTITKS